MARLSRELVRLRDDVPLDGDLGALALRRPDAKTLAGFLRAAGVDTVILTGVTMAGCVRHSTEDAIAEGFRPIVVREAVGDRVAGVVAWNLFDIDAKFGDVEPVARVLGYLDGLEPRQPVVVQPGADRLRA